MCLSEYPIYTSSTIGVLRDLRGFSPSFESTIMTNKRYAKLLKQ